MQVLFIVFFLMSGSNEVIYNFDEKKKFCKCGLICNIFETIFLQLSATTNPLVFKQRLELENLHLYYALL